MEQLKTIWQIDEIITQEIAEIFEKNIALEKENKKTYSYSEILECLLDKYFELLKNFTYNNEESIFKTKDIIDRIRKYSKGIKKIFEYSSKGQLVEANKEANKLFAISANRESAEAWFPVVKVDKERFWFRSRKPDFDKVFSRRDLFHVPFELRGIIGPNRFSIPGFPCLYLGSTMECAREETGELAVSAISCFKNLAEIDAFDFSFFPLFDSHDENLYRYIVSYPFKIAASIPLSPLKEKNQYKEEYIIPQLLLHCAIKQRGSRKITGILFSSTKAMIKHIQKDNYHQHLNMVVPTLYNPKKDFCSYLSLHFSLTAPQIVPFGYLTEKERIAIEKSLKSKEFKTLIDDEMD